MDENRTIEGLHILIKDLAKEMGYAEFYSFEIDHRPEVGLPYPSNHELLKLTVTYRYPDNPVPQHETFEYLRSNRGFRWYRCRDYKKAGKV